MKRIILAISAALLLLLLCGAASAATVESGTCGAQGDNIEWTLSDTGVLTLTGTGATEDFFPMTSIWKTYGNQLKSIEVGEGITRIGDYCFMGCVYAKTISLPESLREIGMNAFDTCFYLPRIDIPSGVTTIDKYAFSGCRNLQSITLPDALGSISAYTFLNCSSLPTVEIPASVTSVGSYAFLHCESLTELEIPSSVTKLDTRAFCGCDALERVTISGGLQKLPLGAFEYCTSLSEIHLPSTLTAIGDSAFCGCTSLQTIDLPDGLVSLGKFCFDGCTSLTGIEIPAGVDCISASCFNGCTSFAEISLPASVVMVDFEAFDETALTAIDFAGTTAQARAIRCFDTTACAASWVCTDGTFAGMRAPDLTKCGDRITWVFSGDTLTISGTGAMYDFNRYHSGDDIVTTAPWGLYAYEIGHIVVDPGVTVIGTDAFCGMYAAGAVTLPVSLNSVGEGAFSDCGLLADVAYDGTQVQADAIAIGADNDPLLDAVWTVQEVPFDPDAMTTFVLPAGLRVLSAEALSGVDAQKIVLPASLKVIGSRAFADCPNLRLIVFGSCRDTTYETDCLDGTSGVRVMARRGSFGNEFADEMDLPFIAAN